MSKYIFTDEMDEVSGFGGSYEEACRKMIVAGLEWLDAHPDADPKFHENKNVFGIAAEDNDDAKELTKAVVAVDPDVTGAMHHQAIRHILWIKKRGWEKYVEIKTKQKTESKEDTPL